MVQALGIVTESLLQQLPDFDEAFFAPRDEGGGLFSLRAVTLGFELHLGCLFLYRVQEVELFRFTHAAATDGDEEGSGGPVND